LRRCSKKVNRTGRGPEDSVLMSLAATANRSLQLAPPGRTIFARRATGQFPLRGLYVCRVHHL